VRFSPDNKLVASWGGPLFNEKDAKDAKSAVKVWDTRTGKLVFEHVQKADKVCDWVAFSPDGVVLAVVASAGVVQLFDHASGKLLSEIRTPETAGAAARFSSDGTKLFSWPTGTPIKGGGVGMRAVRLWEVATGAQVQEFEDKVEPSTTSGLFGNPHKCAFSPDGKRVAAVGRGEAVWVWDTATGQKLVQLASPGNEQNGGIFFAAERISFAPDGSTLAVCCRSLSSHQLPAAVSALYAVPSGKEWVRLPDVKSVTFDQSGKTVAVVTGTERRSAKGKADEVTVCELADLLKPQGPAKDK
jgi:WD40 repeat protein